MVSRDDRRAALLLLVLAAAGLAARLVAGGDGPAGALIYRPGAATERPTRDSVVARAARLARPLQAGEKIDLNLASAEELTRLPRIGPGLAARIVADRVERGPFGSPAEVTRVPGIGPVVLKSVRAHIIASGASRSTDAPRRAAPSVTLNTATVAELAQLPGIGPKLAREIVEDRRLRGPYRTVDDLIRVRGIGPVIVDKIRSVATP